MSARRRCGCGTRHDGWHQIDGRYYASAHCIDCARPSIALLRELESRLGVVRLQPVATAPRVSRSTCPLTSRELEVLGRLGEGETYKQIALHLGLSTSTVRSHLVSTYKKLDVVDRAQAVLAAERQGWIGAGDEAPELDYEPDLPPLTATQRAYLTHFDEYLRTRDASARAAMRQGLELMIDEARRPVPVATAA